MSANDRIKRPPLDRLQAIRNWSTLFTGAVAAGDDAGADSGTAERSTSAPLNDVIARSVDLGYRVVDEYVRQGQKAAQRLNQRSYGAQTMAGDVQDLAMRLTQYASDFAGVWLQLVQLAAVGTGTPAAPKTPEQGGPLGPDARAADAADAPLASQSTRGAAEATRVRIEVRSAQPVDVTVDIRPEAARRALIVHALRSVDPDAARLDDVCFEAGSDEVAARLRVHVPAGHAPGIYSGLLIDEQTSRPVGTVSVTIAS
jgi:hypothetical protein